MRLALRPLVLALASFTAALGVVTTACGPSPSPEAPTSPTSSTDDAGTTGEAEATGDAGATPTTDAAATKRTVFIHEAWASCEGGEGPRKCLQVRASAIEEWSLYYGRIEGFTYEEGNRYELVVEDETVENPPADSMSKRTRLVEVVSKEPATKKK